MHRGGVHDAAGGTVLPARAARRPARGKRVGEARRAERRAPARAHVGSRARDGAGGRGRRRAHPVRARQPHRASLPRPHRLRKGGRHPPQDVRALDRAEEPPPRRACAGGVRGERRLRDADRALPPRQTLLRRPHGPAAEPGARRAALADAPALRQHPQRRGGRQMARPRRTILPRLRPASRHHPNQHCRAGVAGYPSARPHCVHCITFRQQH
mmetsp:Transcript_19877/g.64684  ORF Transcript_19877/g.64684 Transcript_19877/m.64684 type:complete len:213 (-) Transcript_19877:37-675(-)